MGSLYNLQYDFIKQNENYLIFFKENGLYQQELSEIQIKMFQTNKIPNLLPLEIEEADFKVVLRYDVSSKRMLNHTLMEKKITLKEYYKTLFNIIAAISDSKIYMLNEKNYIIHKDFIFIGKNLNEIYLTYLPLKEIEKKETVKEEITNFAIDLVANIQELQGNGVQELIMMLKGDSFSIAELKEKLLRLMSSNHLNIGEYASEDNFQNDLNKVQQREDDMPVLKIKPNLKSLSKRAKVLLFSGTMFLIALIWLIYKYFQSEGSFYISIGLTILIIDINIILIKLWRPPLDQNTGENSVKFKKRDISPQIPTNAKVGNIFKKNKLPKDNHIMHYENLANQTTLLTKTDETVLLNDLEKKQTGNYLPKAYLEINRGTKIEKIEINNNNFLIGRNPSAVNYMEDSHGISRMHIEILYTETGYCVRDLGSKNGSFLNDNDLIPNKTYPLNNGDVITLANSKFIFKTG